MKPLRRYIAMGLAFFVMDFFVIAAAMAQVGGGVSGGGQSAGPIAPAIQSPILSACGSGSPSLSGGSNASFGTVTEGTTATGCTLTWAIAGVASARFVAPTCIVSFRTSGVPQTAITAVSTTALTWTNTSASGAVFDYACFP